MRKKIRKLFSYLFALIKKPTLLFIKRMSVYGYLLLFIFLFGLALRVIGDWPGYWTFHQDEGDLHVLARKIVLHGDFKPYNYIYGSLVPLIYALFFAFVFIPFHFIIFTIQNFHYLWEINELGSFSHYRETFLDHGWFYLDASNNYFPHWARDTSAFVSSLVIIAVYFLCKKLFNDRRIGLIAAFLTAINYRHVLSSTLALVDAPVALFATLSILASISLIKRNSIRRYAIVGVSLGLCYSIKFFIYSIPTFLLCHILSTWKFTNGTVIKKIYAVIFNKNFWLAFAVSFIVFAIINPYFFLDHKNAMLNIKHNYSGYNLFTGNHSIKVIYYLLNFGMGRILFLSTILGFIYSLFRYKLSTLILSSTVVTFSFMFLVISSGSVTPPHTWSLIMPLLLIFPSVLVADLSSRIKNRRMSLFCCLIGVVLLGCFSLKNSLLLSYYSSKPQNAWLLNQWLEKNLQNNSYVAGTWGVFFPGERNYRYKEMRQIANKFISLQELQKEKIELAFVTAGIPTNMNDDLSLDNKLMSSIFFNNSLFWDFMKNNYISLTMQELGDYRIVQYSKPSWQTLEPSIMIVKIPKFFNPSKKKVVVSYDFEGENQSKDWSTSSFMSSKTLSYSISPGEGLDGSAAALLKIPEGCYQAKLTSRPFSVEKNRWYALKGEAFRPVPDVYKDGFLRLDFYSKDKKRLKTYVSAALDEAENNKWENLEASGIAPLSSAYGSISFQVDICNGATYKLDNIKLTVSDDVPTLGRREYPYYGTEIPERFIWSPNRWQ